MFKLFWDGSRWWLLKISWPQCGKTGLKQKKIKQRLSPQPRIAQR